MCPHFLETKTKPVFKDREKVRLHTKRSSSFEDKSYACRFAPSFCSSWFGGMGEFKFIMKLYLNMGSIGSNKLLN